MKIEGDFELCDVKRFYLFGLTFTSNCPECGKECVFNGSSEYLSYPEVDKKQRIFFHCSDCEIGWEEFLKLNFDIIEHPDNKKVVEEI
jgi:transcription elongation factor Elf1